jgi:Spy/CpxP family protein refolding chaperone
MKQTLFSWMLAGALAASLVWNLRTMRCTAPEPACGSCGTTEVSCAAALDGLDLSPDQRRALDDWSKKACGSDEDGAAAKVSRELFTLLAAHDVDPERARALAAEASRLRAASLSACVESVLQVRRVLTPEQTAKLLATCCGERE